MSPQPAPPPPSEPPNGADRADDGPPTIEPGLIIGQPEAASHGPRTRGASWASSPGVRASMRANRGRDTGPELALRRAVHALGLRYRVSVRPLKGVRRTADLVFTRARVAVFLDGCFWHGCPTHHTVAVTNSGFWAEKVATNRRRDRDTDHRLAEAGWLAVRVWEHDDPQLAAHRVAAIVRERRLTFRR